MKRLFTLCTCALMLTGYVFAQTSITGNVKNFRGETLPGVNVLLKGTTIGTTTGSDGNYAIAIPEGEGTLVFTFIGFKTQEVALSGRQIINVVLQEDVTNLDEVVIVGYGTQEKADLTGAVATVDMEKTFGSRPVTDLGRGLQGATPGLTIRTGSGDLGKNPKITLRGVSGSLNGDGAKPLILLDNVEIQDLQMVNPDDVESITVLKDAASTSIYGARAAWGVILITTKSGKKNTANRISYSNNFSWSTPTTTPHVASGPEGATMALAAIRRRTPNQVSYGILGARYDDLSVDKMREWQQLYGGQDLGPEMVEGRDFERRDGFIFYYRPWNIDEMYLRDFTPQQKHNISVSGGGEKTSYNLGLGYVGQSGVIKVNPDEYKRYNVSLSVTSTVNEWLDVSSKIMVASSLTTRPFFRLNNSLDDAAGVDAWFNFYRYPETFPYGTYNGYPFRNIITEIEQANMETDKANLARVQVGGTLKLLRGLTVDAAYTYSTTNNRFHSVGGPLSGINHWQNTLQYSGNFQAANADRVISSTGWRGINTGRAFATFVRDLKDHSFKVMAGGDIEYFQSEGQTAQRNQVIDAKKGELALATGDQFADGYKNHWSTLGFFGRLNYSYKDKYLLEVNGRFDGSSRFPETQQWAFFPSMSAGYVLSEEPFMDVIDPVVTFFKVRGSYGSLGNQDVGAYRFLSTMATPNSNWWIGGKNMATVSTPGALSPSLTWETVSTLDFGADVRMFQDQFGITVDWYKRTTSNMITGGVTLPSTFGTAAPVRNFGTMETRGWELALDWTKTFNNGLRLNVMGMLSDFQERLTKFSNSTNNIYGNYEGKVLGEIWGFETDRFFTEDDFAGQDANEKWIPKDNIPDQDDLKGSNAWFSWAPGDIKYKDSNGDGVVDFGANTVDDHGDLKVIGNSTPRYQYGLRLGADYKGFDLSAFVQGVGKRSEWASGPIFIPGFNWDEAWYAHQEDYWTPGNPDAYYPRPTAQYANNNNMNFRVQTKYLMNMAYFRMKNVTLGYSLPQTLTERVKIQKVRVYFSGENLFEHDNLKVPIDPEVDYVKTDARTFGRVYPYRRSYSFGLEIVL